MARSWMAEQADIQVRHMLEGHKLGRAYDKDLRNCWQVGCTNLWLVYHNLVKDFHSLWMVAYNHIRIRIQNQNHRMSYRGRYTQDKCYLHDDFLKRIVFLS